MVVGRGVRGLVWLFRGPHTRPPALRALSALGKRGHDISSALSSLRLVLQGPTSHHQRINAVLAVLSACASHHPPSCHLRAVWREIEGHPVGQHSRVVAAIAELCRVGKDADTARRVVLQLTGPPANAPAQVAVLPSAVWESLLSPIVRHARTVLSRDDLCTLVRVVGVRCAQPSASLANSLLHLLCRARNVQGVQGVLALLEQHAVAPNRDTVCLLLPARPAARRREQGNEKGNEGNEESVASPNSQSAAVVMATALVSLQCKLGRLDEALATLARMDEVGVAPNEHTLAVLLKGCADSKRLGAGLALHSRLRVPPPHPQLNAHVASALVSMYTRCERLDLAMGVLADMDAAGVALSEPTARLLLAACARHADLPATRQLHARLVVPTQALGEAKATAPRTTTTTAGRQAGLLGLSTVLGTALVQAYCKCDRLASALQVLRDMEAQGSRPNHYTFASLLAGCAQARGEAAVATGRALHQRLVAGDVGGAGGHLQCRPLGLNVVVANVLIQMYCSFKDLESAFGVLGEMDAAGIVPSEATYVALAKGCADAAALSHATALHERFFADSARQGGVCFNTVLGNAFVGMFCKCGELQQAWGVWESMETGLLGGPNNVTCLVMAGGCTLRASLPDARRLWEWVVHGPEQARLGNRGAAATATAAAVVVVLDAVLANALVQMFCKCGALRDAMLVFRHAQRSGVRHVGTTVSCLLTQCAAEQALGVGLELRAFALAADNEGVLDTAVGNSLVNLFCKCDRLREALGVVRVMDERGVALNHTTYRCLLKGCGRAGDVATGRDLHARLLQRSPHLLESTVVWNSLINMYGRCGEASEALCVFERMEAPGGAVRDSVSYACAFAACGHARDLEQGQRIHREMLARLQAPQQSPHPIAPTVRTCNALMWMYCQCGDGEQAVAVLRWMDRLQLPASQGSFHILLSHAAELSSTPAAKHGNREGRDKDAVWWIEEVVRRVRASSHRRDGALCALMARLHSGLPEPTARSCRAFC